MSRRDIIKNMTKSESLSTINNDEKVINLGLGDTRFQTTKNILEDTQKHLLQGKTHYTNSNGIEELRSAITRYLNVYGLKAKQDNVIVTSGAMQAVFYSLFLHTERGTRVGLFEPCWLAYKKIIKVLEGEPVFIELQNNKFTLEVLYYLDKQNLDVLIINNPTNPTGKVWTRDELDIITEYCKKHDILIISDEAYNEIVFDKPFFSIGEFDCKSIVINSFSKTFSMTGWRLGYLYSDNKEIVDSITKLQQIVSTCPNSFVQYGTLHFEEDLHETEERNVIYNKNRNLLYNTLKECNLNPVYPEGTFYMWVDVGKDGKEFAKEWFDKYQIIVVPGEAYGESTKNFVRFSYALPYEILKEACERIKCVKKKKR